MRHRRLAIPDVILLEPNVFPDDRGFFCVTYNKRTLAEIVGRDIQFVQDNQSGSVRGVVRGLHYQVRVPQDKLVRVASGVVFDVAVDLRRSSPTFGRWVGERLSAGNKKQLWIPKGFGHGFVAISDRAELVYKVSEYWSPSDDRCIIWNDPDLAIAWPIEGDAILSAKDKLGLRLADAELFD